MKQYFTLLVIGIASAANAQVSAGGRGTLSDVEVVAAKNAERMSALSIASERGSSSSAQVLVEIADLLDVMRSAALEGKQEMVQRLLQGLAAKVLEVRTMVKIIPDMDLQLRIRRAYHTMMNQLGLLIVPNWEFVAVSASSDVNASQVEDIREVSIFRNIKVLRPKPFP